MTENFSFLMIDSMVELFRIYKFPLPDCSGVGAIKII
jgi:hypothetical protein